MKQQKQYTEIIVQASPDWYVTFEPHKRIKAPILDFVLTFRLSNGQEQTIANVVYELRLNVPKLQSSLGVGVENSGLKKTVTLENLEENVG